MRVILGLVLVASACRSAPAAYQQPQVAIRYDDEVDELQVSLVYHDPPDPADESTDSGLDRIGAFGADRRHSVFFAWPANDLERVTVLEIGVDPEGPIWVRKLELDPPEETRQALHRPIAALDEFFTGLQFGASSWSCLPDGRIQFVWRMRFAQASRLPHLHADFWNTLLFALRDPAGATPGEDDADLHRARRGDLWFDLRADALEVIRPTDAEELTELLSALARDTSEPEPGRSVNGVPVYGALAEVEAEGERLVLRWRPGEEGWYRFLFRREDRPSVPSVRD